MTYNTIDQVKAVLLTQARKPNGGTFRQAVLYLSDDRYQVVADQHLTTERDVLEALGFTLVEEDLAMDSSS